MTKIIVFCDGTWNSPDIVEPTSIHKLYKACVSNVQQGQVAVYFEGIGTPDKKFDGAFMKLVKKYGGGAFGWGLDGKVKEAYQFISMVYKPGDEIYLFGFSRGAYTARSVAGMIRKCGIAADTSADGINDAFVLYRKRGIFNHPDKPHILRQRKMLSPNFGTSRKDLDWRNDGSELVNIAYLGVFDTVGARGIPPSLLGPVASLWNSQYKFHDAKLSSLVKSARHAVAVDERRILYKPARWDNVRILNDGDTGPLRPYQQMWFAGNHGIVGGSSETGQPLSIIPQDWILAGAGSIAIKRGLKPDTSTANPLHLTPDINDDGGLLKKWRLGPQRGDSVHPSVVERVKGLSGYRPRTLRLSIAAWLRG